MKPCLIQSEFGPLCNSGAPGYQLPPPPPPPPPPDDPPLNPLPLPELGGAEEMALEMLSFID